MPPKLPALPMLCLDAHADTPQRLADESWNFDDPLQAGHLNLASAREGGLSGEFFAIWPEPRQWAGRYAVRTLQLIRAVQEQVHRRPDRLALCRSAREILAAHASGRFAVLMGIEGGHAIENSLDRLREFHAEGVRYMTLTWANSNDWADSSGDLHDLAVAHHGGLTRFGREVVGEMNRLGMMVDVSHVSDATFADVLEVSSAPVIASHSNARRLTASPRNLTDDQIRAIARSGGAVMANFYPAFLDESWREAWDQLTPQRREEQALLQQAYDKKCLPVPHAASDAIDRQYAAQLPRAPLSTLIDHILYLCEIAGAGHVGLGSDFDGVPALPEGIDSAADLPKIAEALKHRGAPPSLVEGIFGQNLLRVMQDVEAASSPA